MRAASNIGAIALRHYAAPCPRRLPSAHLLMLGFPVNGPKVLVERWQCDLQTGHGGGGGGDGSAVKALVAWHYTSVWRGE
jgi:hypothetical protein